MINPLRAAISQYYILEYPDDIMWVYYAQLHFSDISGLLTDKMGTGLRPVISILYYIGYALWGSNEMYYYLMNGVLFTGAMVFLYLLIRMLHGKGAGMIAVMLYLFLDSSFILVWKLNFTTSIAEMFFITSSLYYSIHFFEKKEKKSLVLAVILGILAFFSKEPSMVIIPAVNIIYLLHKNMEARIRAVAIAVNLLPVILLYVITAYISPEVSVSAGTPVSERIKERLVYYVEQELSWQLKNPYIFFLGIAGTFYFRKFAKDSYGGVRMDIIKNAVTVSLVAAAYLAIRAGTLYSLSGAIIVMLLLTLGFVFGNSIQRIGIAWFGVGFVPLLLTTQIVQPTYLAEPNLGMSLFLGVTLWEYLKYIYSARPNNNISRISSYATTGVVLLVVLVQLSALPVQIGNTNNYHTMVSDTQASFREAVEYITATVPQNSTLYYISNEDRQKVGGGQIDDQTFHWLLCFKGRCDIRVEYLANLGEKNDGNVALLSNLDVYIFTNEYKNLNTRVHILKSIKNGERVAYVLGLNK